MFISTFKGLKGLNTAKLVYKTTIKTYFNYPCPRKLREIMKMSLIEREDKEKIEEIWKSYHNEKNRCFGVVEDGPKIEKMFQK